MKSRINDQSGRAIKGRKLPVTPKHPDACKGT